MTGIHVEETIGLLNQTYCDHLASELYFSVYYVIIAKGLQENKTTEGMVGYLSVVVVVVVVKAFEIC